MISNLNILSSIVKPHLDKHYSHQLGTIKTPTSFKLSIPPLRTQTF